MHYRQDRTPLHLTLICLLVMGVCALPFDLVTEETVEVCRFGWRAENETCHECRCFGGEEFNKSTESQLQQSETTGFLECPPCVPCPAGRYRIPDSPNMWCSRCRLDCAVVNKHWKVPCGNISPGVCGNCLNGFGPLSADPNSACVEMRLSTVSPVPTPVTCEAGFYLREGVCHQCRNCSHLNRQVTTPCLGRDPGQCGDCFNGFTEGTNGSCIERTDTPHENADKADWKVQYLLLGMVALIIAALLVVIIGKYICRKRVHQDSNRNVSSVAVSTESKIPFLDHSNDIQVDGPQNENERGELPTIVNIETDVELDAFIQSPGASGISRQPNENVHRAPEYLTDVFTRDHCIELSKLISGDEKVIAFFRELDMRETFYRPYQDKFYRQIISYPDYVYGALNDWRMAFPKVTVDCICRALKATRFTNVIPDFLYNIQIKSV